MKTRLVPIHFQNESDQEFKGQVEALKVSNGTKLMDELTSHHYLLTSGHNQTDIEIIASIFDLEVSAI